MNYKHGLCSYKLNMAWRNMKYRCYNENGKYYKYYGGRGITVCGEWLNLNTFIEWCLANGWKEGLFIDRINNDGNYEPDNCRFVTAQTNSCNQRLLSAANTSGYRGVSWSKANKKWHSLIRFNSKKKHLGYFDSPRLAAIRYDVEAFLLDDGRPMNFIEK